MVGAADGVDDPPDLVKSLAHLARQRLPVRPRPAQRRLRDQPADDVRHADHLAQGSGGGRLQSTRHLIGEPDIVQRLNAIAAGEDAQAEHEFRKVGVALMRTRQLNDEVQCAVSVQQEDAALQLGWSGTQAD